MNAAPAQVHAVLWGKDAFGGLEVHGSMELLKASIRQAGFVDSVVFIFLRFPYRRKTHTIL
jgi:hypothetical protein